MNTKKNFGDLDTGEDNDLDQDSKLIQSDDSKSNIDTFQIVPNEGTFKYQDQTSSNVSKIGGTNNNNTATGDDLVEIDVSKLSPSSLLSKSKGKTIINSQEFTPDMDQQQNMVKMPIKLDCPDPQVH